MEERDPASVRMWNLEAWVFFVSVLPALIQAQGVAAGVLHGVFGAWLLVNVLLNHALSTFSSPGTTLEEDDEEMRAVATPEWRWCNMCARPKPPMAHHCSVCNKCVLKMDHHCVWMANCIGFNNYRFFFLYIWWMWVGCIYSATATYLSVRARFKTPRQWMDADFLSFFMTLMAGSAWIGLSVLLGWHVWMIVSGSGTIDSMMLGSGRAGAHDALSNPYDLGPSANFRETFDVSGRLWWVAWMLPTLHKKRGQGFRLPTNKDRSGSVAMLPV